jgi:hypothetical protein
MKKNSTSPIIRIFLLSLLFASCTKQPQTTDTTNSKLIDPSKNPFSTLSSSNGIGSPTDPSNRYDMSNGNDRIIPFDFYGTGKATELVCYRPSTGIVWILNNSSPLGTTPTFMPIFKSTSGIGGYNLAVGTSVVNSNYIPGDQVFPYDCDGTGKLDHLVLYRPGNGIIWILKNTNGVFTPVINSSNGIGGYNLTNGDDRIIPFDYYGTGKAKQLVCYRPSTGIIWILNNTAPQGSTPNFTPIFKSTTGIGGYNLGVGTSVVNSNFIPGDQVFPYDYDGSGKLDHLVLYRPGNRIIWILKNTNGVFSPVFNSSNGIGGYDMSNSNDRIIPYDFYGTGKATQLVCYRPSTGIVWVLNNTAAPGASPNYTSIFQSTTGIGGYNLGVGTSVVNSNFIPGDQAFSYDYSGIGNLDHLVLYRPGNGIVWILQHPNGSQTFSQIY